MANICFTDVTFYSEDKESLEKAFTIIDSAREYSRHEDKNDKGWLGYIEFFIDNREIPKELMGIYRGWIQYIDEICEMEYENKTLYYFYIHVDDSWRPHIRVYDEICKKYENIKYAFRAEESGFNLYACYDPLKLFYTDEMFGELSYIDDDGYNQIEISYGTQEMIVVDFNNSLSKSFESFDDIAKWVDKFDDDDCYFIVHEYDSVDPDQYRQSDLMLLGIDQTVKKIFTI